jgi:ribose 5-phosphate isomerase B
MALKRVVIGCDHGALQLKDELVAFLTSLKYPVQDVGVHTTDRVDYPDIAATVCGSVLSGEADAGIVLCGTGIGISIAANKHHGIRCALCHDHYTATLSRQHNDANVLAIGGRVTGVEVAKELTQAWLTTDFEGGRHSGRVAKIAKLEC